MAKTASELAPEGSAAPPPLAENLCWLLSQASYLVSTELTAGLEKLGISPRAHAVLATAMDGEHTQTELAKLVGLDKTTMVVTLDELEAQGLAERRPSKTDRRARVVAVTTAGRRKVRKAEQIAEEIHAHVLEALPAEQGDSLLSTLTWLVCSRSDAPTPCAKPPRRR